MGRKRRAPVPSIGGKLLDLLPLLAGPAERGELHLGQLVHESLCLGLALERADEQAISEAERGRPGGLAGKKAGRLFLQAREGARQGLLVGPTGALRSEEPSSELQSLIP